LKEVNARLGFLLDVGLEYLTLDRAAATCRVARPSAFAWRRSWGPSCRA
jgi:hypothetical protein